MRLLIWLACVAVAWGVVGVLVYALWTALGAVL